MMLKDDANLRKCYALGLKAEKDQLPCFLDEKYPEKELLGMVYNFPPKNQRAPKANIKNKNRNNDINKPCMQSKSTQHESKNTNSSSNNLAPSKSNRRRNKKRKNRSTTANVSSIPIKETPASIQHSNSPQPQSTPEGSNATYLADVRGRLIRTHHRSKVIQFRKIIAESTGFMMNTTIPQPPHRQTAGQLADSRPIFIEEFAFQEDRVYHGRVLTGTLIEAPNASTGIYTIISFVFFPFLC